MRLVGRGSGPPPNPRGGLHSSLLTPPSLVPTASSRHLGGLDPSSRPPQLVVPNAPTRRPERPNSWSRPPPLVVPNAVRDLVSLCQGHPLSGRPRSSPGARRAERSERPRSLPPGRRRSTSDSAPTRVWPPVELNKVPRSGRNDGRRGMVGAARSDPARASQGPSLRSGRRLLADRRPNVVPSGAMNLDLLDRGPYAGAQPAERRAPPIIAGGAPRG